MQSINIPQNSRAKFHIAFAVNDAFAIGAGVCIISILENNPSINFEFHIFGLKKLSNSNTEKIESIVKKYRTIIKFHVFENHQFEPFLEMEIFKLAPYSLDILTRLLIPEYFYGFADRILYLDADVVCDGKIDSFLSMDLCGNILAARIDNTPHNEIKLGLKPNTYFNAGLLYIDVNEWHRQEIYKKILDALGQNKNIFLPDQDGLNVVLQDKVLYLSENHHYHYFFDRPNQAIVTEKIFIHYLGCIKPWHGKFAETVPFNKYKINSPWKDHRHSWVHATSLQLRVYARYLFRHRQYLSGLKYYLRYLKAKIAA